MKKLLLLLALGLWNLSIVHAATLTVSNYNGLAIHGIADSGGTLIGAEGGYGVIGRMTIPDNEVVELIEAKDFVALENAFEVFASSSGPFALNSLGADGAFEVLLSESTIPSAENQFGGSSLFIWLYTGNDISTATNYLLAKLPSTFPTDPEAGPPVGPVEVFLRPDATFFAGTVSGSTHDYGLGGGAVAILQMDEQEHNQAPVAEDGMFVIAPGGTEEGTLVASDPEDDDLVFSVVTDATQGSLDVNPDGTFSYKADANATGTDSFTFQVYDGALDSNVATVTITFTAPPEPEVPEIAIAELPLGYVGSYYEFEIPIANLPQGEATSYAASGLPPGLKLNTKTGVISGYPSKAYESGKEVSLSAKNAVGTGEKVSATITIKPVPMPVIGSFVASVERGADVAEGQGGRLDLTTTSKGSFTAKLLVGTVSYTGKGYLEIEEGEESSLTVGVSVQFIRKGYPTLLAQLQFDLSEGPDYDDFQLTGTLGDVDIEMSEVDVTGVRNTWSKTDEPTDYLGAYTYGLDIPGAAIGDPKIPQGVGFGALTVSAKGTVSFVGKTADGKPFTVSSVLGRHGHMPFYCALAGGSGSLVSVPEVTLPGGESDDLNELSGVMSWSKPEATEKSKERAYREGFDAINLTLFGGLYQGPEAGEVVAGLDDNGPTDTTTKNAWLSFLEGGLEEGDVDPFAFVVMNKKDSGVTQTVIIPKFNAKLDPNPNPNSITFKLLSKPAGYFTGTFTIPNEVKSLVRKVTYQGTFIRNPDGTFQRLGYFLLPQLPIEEGEKLSKTPVLSGVVDLNDRDPESE